jgi:hypothetical protein
MSGGITPSLRSVVIPAGAGFMKALRREGFLNLLSQHIVYQIVTSCKKLAPPIRTPRTPLPNFFK